MTGKIRHSRIKTLYDKAKTGKYTWDDLRTHGMAMGVNRSVVNGYLDDVYEMLKKAGYLK